MSPRLNGNARLAGTKARGMTLTEAFPDPAKSTFPDACLLRFRISPTEAFTLGSYAVAESG